MIPLSDLLEAARRFAAEAAQRVSADLARTRGLLGSTKWKTEDRGRREEDAKLSF